MRQTARLSVVIILAAVGAAGAGPEGTNAQPPTPHYPLSLAGRGVSRARRRADPAEFVKLVLGWLRTLPQP